VSVLGANALAGIDQNNVLSATRGGEVMADPTTALAVECARRRRAGGGEVLRLCASHRLIRMQPLTHPSFTRHFRLFVLAHAGRDTGDERFEGDALREQCAAWLRLGARLRDAGYRVARMELIVSDTRIVGAALRRRGVDLATLRGHVDPMAENAANPRLGLDLPAPDADPARAGAEGRDLEGMERVERTVLAPLRAEHPGTETRFDFQKLHGLDYYDGLTLSFAIVAPDGSRWPVGDGGFSRWTAELLGNRKERFLASAIGSELVCKALSESV
jgi:hypothetical protein